MASEVAAIYRQSKKKQDINWFTEWIARPPAAVIVYLLRSTPITPNQVTFLSAFIAAGACAVLILCLGWIPLVIGAALFELSFVLDCADGMLARLRKLASPLGHLLDFLMDELKAMLLYGAVAVRMWREHGNDDRMLLIGLAGGFCLASGIALTSFMRRPEYGGKGPTEDGDPAEVKKRRGVIGLAVFAIEWPARVIVHYPQYIWICALANHIDVYFYAYGAVNALYFAKSFAVILVRLGRFNK
jgi:hypothetical protein